MSLKPILKYVKPFMFTLHIAGGKKMLEEAVKIVNQMYEPSQRKPMIIGVTILTSLSKEDLKNLGHQNQVKYYVLKYANIAEEAGLDGIVCSPLEIKFVKEVFGKKLKIITPGIRLNEEKKKRSIKSIKS